LVVIFVSRFYQKTKAQGVPNLELLVLFLNLNYLWSRNRKGKVIKDGESAFLPMELDHAAYMESL